MNNHVHTLCLGENQGRTEQMMPRRTSSAYYARKRMEEPVRYCVYCGQPIVRRQYGGRMESNGEYRKRVFCSRACHSRSLSEGRKAEREAEIAKQYKACRGVDGLYVDRKGNFLYQGKEKKVSRYVYPDGRKRTALVAIMHLGKQKSYRAARLVWEAFNGNLGEDDVIDYADGDIHNIALDNLRILGKAEYNRVRSLVAASYRKVGTAQYQIHRLRNVVTGAMAVLHYFETGDLSELHRFVGDELYPLLTDWCIRSLHYAKERAMDRTADALARFYETVLAGHAVSYPERYCKMLLQSEKRLGQYSHRGDVPKEIGLMVNEVLNNKNRQTI